MKINVLVVNDNHEEGRIWRKKIANAGYRVLSECLDMSDLFYTLTQENVNIVICAGSLFNEETIPLLQASQEHFPRIKIVLVGMIARDYLFSNLSNVAITKWLPTDLEKYCNPVPVTSAFDLDTPVQALSVLIGDHFLSGEEASLLLAKTSKLVPGYVVICVRKDSANENVRKALYSCIAEHKSAFVFQYQSNEFIVILDNSPSPEYCRLVAGDLRAALLRDTDTMFSIGISRLRYKAEELYACRREAGRACSATHMFGQNSVIHIDYLDSSDIEYIYPTHKEKRLIEATMDGDTAVALQMLDEIFAVLKSCNGVKQSLINKMVLEILVGLNIAASSRVSSYEKMNLDSLSLKTLMSVKTTAEAHEFLKQGIFDFANEMGEITDVTLDALYHKLSVAKEIPDSAEKLVKKFGTTLSFINKAIYKNSKSDVFSFIREK